MQKSGEEESVVFNQAWVNMSHKKGRGEREREGKGPEKLKKKNFQAI